MRHIEINKEWNERNPFYSEKVIDEEHLKMANELVASRKAKWEGNFTTEPDPCFSKYMNFQNEPQVFRQLKQDYSHLPEFQKPFDYSELEDPVE